MEKFNLCEALREYRKTHALTQQQMGKKLNMSRQAYNRLEKGSRKPTFEEVEDIIEVLDLKGADRDIEAMPAALPKWYQNKMWRWLAPLFYSYLMVDLAVTVSFSNYINGKQLIQDDLPISGFIVGSLIFCAFYWYFKPPLWRRPSQKELFCGTAAIVGFLILIFHEDVFTIFLNLTDPYLNKMSAGPWIVIAFLSALLLLCIWTLRASILARIGSTLNPIITRFQIYRTPRK